MDERGRNLLTCNCRDKTSCTLKGKCLQEGVLYKAIVTQTESMKQDIDYLVRFFYNNIKKRVLNNVELQYKSLRILSRYCSCQDSEFRSAIETSSVDKDKLLSKNFFLWIHCPKISLLLFKDGADIRMESFSCKQSPHTSLF